jgi:uncharacterized protein YdgA (DUF945 family)
MSKAAYLLAIPVIVAAAWGGTTWYVGSQTKTLMEDSIKQQNELSGVHGVQTSIVSFDQGLLGSKAILKVTFTQPPLSEVVKELKFNADIKNGPVFLTNGLGTGLSRWVVTLDQESIADGAIKTLVKDGFKGKDPFVATVDVGFNNNYNSTILVNPLTYSADDNNFTFAGGTIKSTGNATDYTGTATVEANEVKLTDATGFTMTMPKTTADLAVTGTVGSTMLGTLQMKSDKVSFSAKELPQPISFDLTANTDSGKTEQALKGSATFSASNITGVPENLVTRLNYDLKYSDLKIEGIEELNTLQLKLQDIQANIARNEADAETPEGQRKITELYGNIQAVAGQMMETTFNKVLVADKSRVIQKVALEGAKGKSNVDLDLLYHGGKQTPTVNDVMMGTFTPEQWADLLRGSISLNTDKALLPEMAAMMLMQPIQDGLIVDSANQYKVDLKLNGEQVELNGKAMPVKELIAKVTGGAGAAPEEEADTSTSGEGVTAADLEPLGVPAEIAKEIEANGLTPDIMKKLESNKDISPDVVEMMRQLQQMQQAPEDESPEGDSPEEKAPEGTTPDQPAQAQ